MPGPRRKHARLVDESDEDDPYAIADDSPVRRPPKSSGIFIQLWLIH